MILYYVKKSYWKYKKILYNNFISLCLNFRNTVLLDNSKKYESTISIVQLYNLAKLRKWKSK